MLLARNKQQHKEITENRKTQTGETIHIGKDTREEQRLEKGRKHRREELNQRSNKNTHYEQE
jgi:hypothetical protein